MTRTLPSFSRMLSCFFLLLSAPAFSQNCGVFFSEYLEGTSNNKAIELYNNTGNTINLADYVIYRYNNGSPVASDSMFMHGLLPHGGVYVAGNPSAVAAILSVSDTLHTITFFNGDDAMALKQISTGTMLDVIGIIGNDPGTNWAVGTGATSEFTLVRNFSITQGTTNWTIGATQWDVHPQNTFSFLGSHSGATCCVNTSASLTTSACDSMVSPSGLYTWTSTGIYNDTLTNSGGCDSVITVDLTVYNSSTSAITPVVCDSYTSPSGNHTWTVSGTYADTIANSNGCDSIITINLTVNQSSTSAISPVVCDTYTSPSGNYTWTMSGTYMDTIPNGSGCDSIITIALTVNHGTMSVITPVVCNSYTSPSGNYTWTVSGVYADTLANSSGCDSIIVVNLTVNHDTVSTISPVACFSYTSPSGNYTWTSSGTYIDTIPSGGGCDSVITINLTITTINDTLIFSNGSMTAGESGATYQWYECDLQQPIPGETGQTFTPTVPGNYAVIITNNGCTDTSYCQIIASNGKEALAWDAVISAFPNPSSEQFTVAVGNDYEGFTLDITDITGRAIRKGIPVTSSHMQLSLDRAGMYFVIVRNGALYKTLPLVIED